MTNQRTSDIYPRLYHYTTLQGAYGILQTNQLWATHYKFMNDHSEMVLFRERLIEFLRPHVLQEHNKLIAEDTHASKTIDAAGGLGVAVDHATTGLVDAMYKSMHDEFYIVALCGERRDQYINANGLLSQWRGYGADGGIALVFQTSELEESLRREAELFDYDTGFIGDAVYSHDESKFEQELSGPLGVIADYIKRLLLHMKLGRDNAPDASQCYPALVSCASRYKHRGFSEENEVRIVAAPTPHSPEVLMAAKDIGAQLKAEKQRKFRDGPRGPRIPYIELFASLNVRLPIEEVIVGPHREKESRASALRVMLRSTNIRVSVSQIPYVC